MILDGQEEGRSRTGDDLGRREMSRKLRMRP